MTETTTAPDTYQGWANRETWAFNVHWSNDQALYVQTLADARTLLERVPDATDDVLGSQIIANWRDVITEDREQNPTHLRSVLAAWDHEVGSWWRIDRAEIGASVRESLDIEA